MNSDYERQKLDKSIRYRELRKKRREHLDDNKIPRSETNSEELHYKSYMYNGIWPHSDNTEEIESRYSFCTSHNIVNNCNWKPMFCVDAIFNPKFNEWKSKVNKKPCFID